MGNECSESASIAMSQYRRTSVRTEPLRPLTLMLAIVCVVLFTIGMAFSSLLRHENIGLGYLSRAALFFVLLIAIANGIAGRTLRKAFTPGQLLFLFCLLSAIGSIPGQEYGMHFYLYIVGIVYEGHPGATHGELIAPHIPASLVPSTDPYDPSIAWAFESMPEGAGIPYIQWIKPLAIWTVYFLLLYGMFLCLAAMLSHRWEDEERLLFPLTQVPLSIVEDGKPPHWIPQLLRNPLMWLGFIISCTLYSIRGLHYYFPSIPDINLQPTTGQLFPSGPERVFNNMRIEIRPDMIGIAYLLALDVSFSFWLFYLLRRFEQMARIIIGITTAHGEFFRYQTIGAYIAFALTLLWSARYHLWHLVREAFAENDKWRSREIANAPMTPRIMLFGFVGAFIGVLSWCYMIGMSLRWSALMYISFIGVALVVSRVVCEAGIMVYTSPFWVYQTMFETFGVERIGVKNVVLMTMASWCQLRSTASTIMPVFLQNYKLGSLAQLNRKHLSLATALAVALSFLTSHWAYPQVIYRYGVGKLSHWAQRAPFNTVNLLASNLSSSRTIQPQNWRAMGLGAVVAIALVWLRLHWTNFPLHPLGWIVIIGWPIDRYWFSIFWGWLARIVVTRIGGFHAWRSFRPLAYGLIIGTAFILTVWAIIHYRYPAPPVMLE